ncbi:DUF6250 domain-containing protein [Pseudomonas sp. LJDD11]|uniref:DUF6250 domain-containing protein n=1 Tax=Pseudomonas sp. LJDD11 TaxID=2931984 RepID=UPI00211BB70A|nr:DUF6250 domain-containing protein [Pseudomonas sp. LJDD11]MCQ9427323.1 DUF6250 domain-containing protein [Pseudomonas sp. LJDD11]
MLSQIAQPAPAIEQDDFSALDPQRWRIETQDPAGSAVYVEQQRLIMDTRAGMTVWLDRPLRGAYRIEFLRQVLVAGQANDRLSDMNLFWGAHEPDLPDGHLRLARRNGVLEAYDNMASWYVGMGGNGNSTTRFRWYDGSGERHLLGEHLQPDYLLEAGRIYRIRVEVSADQTAYWVDDRLMFQQALDGRSTDGYFGFRSVWSRQTISRFRVTAL